MTQTEQDGQTVALSSNAPSLAQPLDSSSWREGAIFYAGGKPVMPYQATYDGFKKVVDFCYTWPLISAKHVTYEQMMAHLLAPSTVLLDVDDGNGLIMLEDVVPGRDANTGFLFWDKKVSEKQKLLTDVFTGMVSMLGLERLTSYIPEKNRVMWRMYEKIGFQQEGRMRNAFFLPDGRICDYLIYGKIREEFGK